MPKSGFTSITVHDDLYQKIKQKMKKANEKAGYRKFRSLTHFVEEAVMKFEPKTKEEST